MSQSAPPGNPQTPASMGLLAYISTHPLDEDYGYVSACRGQSDAKSPRRRPGAAGAVIAAVFAVLVVTAGVQTSRNAANDEQQRRELLSQVNTARDTLEQERDQIRALQSETARLQARRLRSLGDTRALNGQIRALGTRAGTVPVEGPGVRVVANDAVGAASAREKVLDSDLQRLVNGLWAAGAEAIAVNGHRLTNLSAIRVAGDAITVNNRSLRRPYVVEAIGNQDTLPARFAETTSGQAWLDLQREIGLRLRIETVDSMRLPAVESPTLRYANRSPGGIS
ncbi:MAG TPA: DUF881 domain-containing protein [Marmoricola sp.]|nr:DUF881 domain-containing protein [Marmoricola sp.]